MAVMVSVFGDGPQARLGRRPSATQEPLALALPP
jgi:hypothetical protein